MKHALVGAVKKDGGAGCRESVLALARNLKAAQTTKYLAAG
jgi:hypothetical protein